MRSWWKILRSISVTRTKRRNIIWRRFRTSRRRTTNYNKISVTRLSKLPANHHIHNSSKYKTTLWSKNYKKPYKNILKLTISWSAKLKNLKEVKNKLIKKWKSWKISFVNCKMNVRNCRKRMKNFLRKIRYLERLSKRWKGALWRKDKVEK